MNSLSSNSANPAPAKICQEIRQPLTGRALAGALVRHPFMTGKVIAAIYWQALRLKLKRVPVHPHPRSAGRET